ncbi:MAG: hypothetical protein HOP28_08255, partial [Gemmatimonadales bacterium]|nr:hypothetical protein [Gemmatimonadales bacterium]
MRDGAGRALSGVTVTFQVDSGGGSIQTASATSAADGTASPGDWRLGPAEGRNVIRAAAGALTPAKLGAAGVFGTKTLHEGDLVSGTIAVTADGPLKGTTLEVPSGAFPSSIRWSLEQRSAGDWPLRPGITTVGAAMQITSTASGMAAVPLKLTLPAPLREGFQRFILIRNPVTGAVDVLPTAASSPTTVTALAPHFFGNALEFARATASNRARLVAGGYDAMVVVADIAQADLDRDFDTGFRPGVDDWEFRSVRTELVPEGMHFGKQLSAMVHFAYRKASHGALWRKYQEATPIVGSNRLGLRVTSLFELTKSSEVVNNGIVATRNALPLAVRDQVFYSYLKASLLVTGLPQVISATSPDP